MRRTAISQRKKKWEKRIVTNTQRKKANTCTTMLKLICLDGNFRRCYEGQITQNNNKKQQMYHNVKIDQRRWQFRCYEGQIRENKTKTNRNYKNIAI